MSNIAGRFIKNLLAHNVLFGLRTKKLTGINDSTHTFTGNIDIQAPDTITFPLEIPQYLEVGRYFRVTGGGGANEDLLFRVDSLSGLDLIVDTSVNNLTNFNGLATVDARFAIVHNDENISRINAIGKTIYNTNNFTTTGVEGDGSEIAKVCDDHYHSPPPGLELPHTFMFDLTDWFLTDAGDTYSIDVAHDLNTLYPSINIFEDNSEVFAHNIRIIDENTVRIKVAAAGSDCRFPGRGIISAH